MVDGVNDIKRKLTKRIGFFGQQYLSIRTSGFEITLDNLTPSGRYLVCICTPYNERMDGKKRHKGIGGGEVKDSWIFDSEEEALTFLSSKRMV